MDEQRQIELYSKITRVETQIELLQSMMGTHINDEATTWREFRDTISDLHQCVESIKLSLATDRAKAIGGWYVISKIAAIIIGVATLIYYVFK